jgi:hypothetical protein
MILLIDNYDSFTYNLSHYLQTLGSDVRVVRNDAMTAGEMFALNPAAVVLSPGPSSPENAGVCVEFVKRFAGKIPMFGVCLGMQSIGYAFGGKIVHAMKTMHGKIGEIEHCGKGCFKGMPSPMSVVRYHSLAVERSSLPDCLEVTASADDGEIMGLRHRQYLIEGVQFHPESIMTYGGKRLLANFLAEADAL